MTRAWDELRLAIALLTRLPVGRIAPCPPMGAAVWAFPLAGLVPGLATGLVLWAGLAAGLPPLAAAFLGLATGAWATGGMHEDGLADLTDGLSGGRTQDRRLEIMRDSRIGAHGALALCLSIGLRAAALAALSGAAALAVPVATAMLSRATMGAILAALKPARADGLGRSAAQGMGAGRGALGAALALLGALSLLGPVGGFVAALACAATALAVAGLACARLGGQTGDVLGAAQVAAECTALLVLCRA